MSRNMFVTSDNKVSSVEIPVACTLSPLEAHTRVEEWQVMVDRCVANVSRVDSNRLDLSLHPDLDDVASLMKLVQQEKACCAFFDFTFAVEADAVTLVVRVPESAVGVLDEFAASLTTP
jgi:hypothetical protein